MNYAGHFFKHSTHDRYIAITEDNDAENFLSTVVVDVEQKSISNNRIYIKCLEAGRNKEYKEISLVEFTEVYGEVRHITEINFYKALRANETYEPICTTSWD